MLATHLYIPESWIVPASVTPVKGIRSSQPDLQVLCDAGPYELDILVRPFKQLEFYGQVISAEHVFQPVEDLPVTLVWAEADIETTKTNAFGEFRFASARRGAYGLRLGQDPDAPCVLVWGGRE
jgi:hypothetical protein